MNAVALEGFRNADAPDGGHSGITLAPFQAGVLGGVELGGRLIDELPRESLIGHSVLIGQIVPSCKDKLPNDSQAGRWHNVSMPRDTTSSAYRDQFTARVKALREGKRHSDGGRWTAADMAFALGIAPETYRKYESRSLLPHEHLKRFAMLTGVSVEYLLTGNRSTADARAEKPLPGSPDSSDHAEIAASK